jgi:hypothetical protein
VAIRSNERVVRIIDLRLVRRVAFRGRTPDSASNDRGDPLCRLRPEARRDHQGSSHLQEFSTGLVFVDRKSPRWEVS